MELKIDWSTHEAAEFACTHWHYSKCLPTGKLVKIGAWEDGKFIGVVIFSRGASPHLLTKYGLSQFEGCELTRIALTKHATPVSRIMSIALKFLKKQSTGLKLAVSFADPEQGHHGGIYQATNWVYTGTSGETIEYFVKGKWRHVRGAYDLIKNADRKFPVRERKGKHRYLFALDESIAKKLESLKQPYPKKVSESAAKAEASMRPRSTREKDGSSPISSLQKKAKKKTVKRDPKERPTRGSNR